MDEACPKNISEETNNFNFLFNTRKVWYRCSCDDSTLEPLDIINCLQILSKVKITEGTTAVSFSLPLIK